MAKYTIMHKCGHEAVRQLYGPTADRRRKIEWLEQQKCDACQQAEHDAATDAYETRAGLPELTGSEKQIAWARDIRVGVFRCLRELDSYTFDDRTERLLREWCAALRQPTEAAWWIKRRLQLPFNPRMTRINVLKLTQLYKYKTEYCSDYSGFFGPVFETEEAAAEWCRREAQEHRGEPGVMTFYVRDAAADWHAPNIYACRLIDGDVRDVTAEENEKWNTKQ